MATLVVPTAERILRDVRIRLNQPKAENSRWSDPELIDYINEGVQQVYLVVNEMGEGQFDTSTTLNTTSGSATVDLPTDCFSVKAVYFRQGTINRRLDYKNSVVDDTDSVAAAQGNFEPSYYFRGNKLVLRPTPGFTSTDSPITLEYTKYPTVLVYGADTLDSGVSPLFKQLLVAYAVTEAKRKDDLVNNGNTRSAAESHLGDLWQNFRHQLSERSKAPQYITPFEPT